MSQVAGIHQLQVFGGVPSEGFQESFHVGGLISQGVGGRNGLLAGKAGAKLAPGNKETNEG